MLQKGTIWFFRVYHILRSFYGVLRRGLKVFVLEDLQILILKIGEIDDVDSTEDDTEEKDEEK